MTNPPTTKKKEKIDRVWAMPNKYTFGIKPIKELLKEEMDTEDWVDPFAGMLSPATHKNDIDEGMTNAQYHEDALVWLKGMSAESVNGVLFDPPYSVEQALRKYKPIQGGTAGRVEYWGKCKDEIKRIVKPGGKAICFGWDSNGVGKSRGFGLERVLLVCHGACHNDTIVTVERKI